MPLQFNPVKLFAGSGSKELAQKIAEAYGRDLGDVVLSRFSDGEFQPHFNESVRGCDVFLIQSTHQPTDNLMELLMMIDAARRASAHYVNAVIPYFGLARQDRKDKPRVAISAKLVANLLVAAGIDRIVTMDLHAAQIQGFFDIPVDHLDASIIFVPYIKSLGLGNLTIASPDMGGSYRARSFAKWLFAINAVNVPMKLSP
jgi:ribose-phosphate pyrophosphokinase